MPLVELSCLGCDDGVVAFPVPEHVDIVRNPRPRVEAACRVCTIRHRMHTSDGSYYLLERPTEGCATLRDTGTTGEVAHD